MADQDPFSFAEQWREFNDRKPSPYPHLLMALHDKRDAFIAADLTRDSAYEEAYFEAARRLSAAASTGVLVDHDLLPVLYLYRHFVELMLKSCILCLSAHLHAHDRSFRFQMPPGHHKLIPLLGHVRGLNEEAAPYLDRLEFPSKQAQEFIEELGAIDEGAVAFRYLRDRETGDRTITKDLRVNLDVLDAGMLHVKKELTAYRDTIEISTGLYFDYMQDIGP